MGNQGHFTSLIICPKISRMTFFLERREYHISEFPCGKPDARFRMSSRKKEVIGSRTAVKIGIGGPTQRSASPTPQCSES
jgi:hypothetical protein